MSHEVKTPSEVVKKGSKKTTEVVNSSILLPPGAFIFRSLSPQVTPWSDTWYEIRTKEFEEHLASKIFYPYFEHFRSVFLKKWPDLDYLKPVTTPELKLDLVREFIKYMKPCEKELFTDAKNKNPSYTYPDPPTFMTDTKNLIIRKMQLGTAWAKADRDAKEYIWRSLRGCYILISPFWLLPPKIAVGCTYLMDRLNLPTMSPQRPTIIEIRDDTKRILELFLPENLQDFWQLWGFARHKDTPIPTIVDDRWKSAVDLILNVMRDSPTKIQEIVHPMFEKTVKETKLGWMFENKSVEFKNGDPAEEVIKHLHTLHSNFFKDIKRAEEVLNSNMNTLFSKLVQQFVTKYLHSSLSASITPTTKNPPSGKSGQIDPSKLTIFDLENDEIAKMMQSKEQILSYEKLQQKVLGVKKEPKKSAKMAAMRKKKSL